MDSNFDKQKFEVKIGWIVDREERKTPCPPCCGSRPLCVEEVTPFDHFRDVLKLLYPSSLALLLLLFYFFDLECFDGHVDESVSTRPGGHVGRILQLRTDRKTQRSGRHQEGSGGW